MQRNFQFVSSVILTVIVVGVIVGVETGAVYKSPSTSEARRKPNFVIFFADDMGYADTLSFGHPTQEWGAIDRMAEEGMKFTQWTSADRLCTPSRASLLTGRYAPRAGIYGQNSSVFQPTSIGGLPREEVTIAEALEELGYETGMAGKWHLGINRYNRSDGYHLPTHHGFNFVGNVLAYTQHWKCDLTMPVEEQTGDCFLHNKDHIVEQPIVLNTLTKRLVKDAKSFIRDNHKKPFFFYLPFPQTHQAMFCDERFCGKSQRGSFGDNVNELAWAVGEVLDEIKSLGIEEDTLAIFTSDHGPERFNCKDEGSPGMFRSGKGTTWEGGFRVPAVVWWPGTITAGKTSLTFVNSLDILPTFLYLAGAPDYMKSRDITIDGQLIPDIINAASGVDPPPRETFFYYCGKRLMAVRYEKYKVHYFTVEDGNTKISDPNKDPLCDHVVSVLRNEFNCYGEHIWTRDPPLVFDIMNDPQEKLLLNTSLPEIQALLEHVNELVTKQNAGMVIAPSELDKGYNENLRPCCNPPKCTCNYNI